MACCDVLHSGPCAWRVGDFVFFPVLFCVRLFTWGGGVNFVLIKQSQTRTSKQGRGRSRAGGRWFPHHQNSRRAIWSRASGNICTESLTASPGSQFPGTTRCSRSHSAQSQVQRFAFFNQSIRVSNGSSVRVEAHSRRLSALGLGLGSTFEDVIGHLPSERQGCGCHSTSWSLTLAAPHGDALRKDEVGR